MVKFNSNLSLLALVAGYGFSSVSSATPNRGANSDYEPYVPSNSNSRTANDGYEPYVPPKPKDPLANFGQKSLSKCQTQKKNAKKWDKIPYVLCKTNGNYENYQFNADSTLAYCVSTYAGIELWEYNWNKPISDTNRHCEMAHPTNTKCRQQKAAGIQKAEAAAKMGMVLPSKTWLECDANGKFERTQCKLSCYRVDPETGNYLGGM